MLILNTSSQKRKTIALQTSKGNDIENYQIEEMTMFELKTGENLLKKYPLFKFKGQPTAIYNCHGLTFASRRTSIGPGEIRKILQEDNYRQVGKSDVMVGDVVVYVSTDGKADIEHTGIVVEIDTAMQSSCIWIYSKWGRYKEVRHPVYDSEYKNCNLEFWRNNHGHVAI